MLVQPGWTAAAKFPLQRHLGSLWSVGRRAVRFFGVGGGFLIVPAQLLVTQMSMRRAVATSLLVIALIGTAGVAASWWQGHDIEWGMAGLFALGELTGMGLGPLPAARVAGSLLQRLFALAMAAVGASMLFTQPG